VISKVFFFGEIAVFRCSGDLLCRHCALTVERLTSRIDPNDRSFN
jgi:hypothetical protein